MTNNHILRNLRYSFDYGDDAMMDLFAKGGLEATRAEVSNWLKKEDHEDYRALSDEKLAAFLNGFIILKRGAQSEDGPPPAEKKLNNNIIFRKLKIALNFKDDDVVTIMESVDFKIGKSELSALFRKPGHKNYRPCKDQILRNFLYAIKKTFRPEHGKKN